MRVMAVKRQSETPPRDVPDAVVQVFGIRMQVSSRTRAPILISPQSNGGRESNKWQGIESSSMKGGGRCGRCEVEVEVG